VGPIGGRSFLHSFTACVLLFGDRGAPGPGDEDPSDQRDQATEAGDPGTGRAGEREQ
jgi:hypothetical protein